MLGDFLPGFCMKDALGEGQAKGLETELLLFRPDGPEELCDEVKIA